MQNNYQTKHPRGSSPPFHEIERGIDRYVSRLSFTKQTPIDTQLEKQKKELDVRIYDPVLQTNDGRNWQDDGGEGG